MPCSVISLVDVVDQPVPGLGVAEVQQSAVLAAEDPFGMVLRQPGAGRDAFRLEPDDDLHALGVGVIADRPKSLGKPPRIDLPRAHFRPAGLLHVPAGVHPPVVELQAFFQIAVDVHDLVLLVGADHLAVGPRAGGHELGGGSLPPGRGTLWAIIQRRQMFCARRRSPFQN